jgi:hypothetical protein
VEGGLLGKRLTCTASRPRGREPTGALPGVREKPTGKKREDHRRDGGLRLMTLQPRVRPSCLSQAPRPVNTGEWGGDSGRGCGGIETSEVRTGVAKTPAPRGSRDVQILCRGGACRMNYRWRGQGRRRAEVQPASGSGGNMGRRARTWDDEPETGHGLISSVAGRGSCRRVTGCGLGE